MSAEVDRVDRWLKLRIEDETRAMDKAESTGMTVTYAMHEYGRRLCAEIRLVLLDEEDA